MIFDTAIIGAGVTGVATARALALAGERVVVIERGSDLLSGASKANSAILHTGFDAPTGSLEHRLVQEGYQAYRALAEREGLSLVRTGAVLVAWNETELAALPGLLATAHANGVADCHLIDRETLLRREPHLSPMARGALVVPGEFVIDPWSPFHAYAMQAMATGAQFHFRATLTAADFDGTLWTLDTSRGRYRCRRVINAAGTRGDDVARLLTGASTFEIRPRKGQFVVFDKAARALLDAILLPVPNERTKGIVITPTAFGNLLVGPTAEEQEERDRPMTDRAALEALIAEAARMIPALATMPVTATYAGIRPATEQKQYRIDVEAARSLITIGGIRSTGLTASLGIARHVLSLCGLDPVDDGIVAFPPVPVLTDGDRRDFTRPGYGEIVCHCEMVTDREIKAALSSPLPPSDLSGLKRRTRCTMGRCQGFHCLSRVMALAEPVFAAGGTASEGGSRSA